MNVAVYPIYAGCPVLPPQFVVRRPKLQGSPEPRRWGGSWETSEGWPTTCKRWSIVVSPTIHAPAIQQMFELPFGKRLKSSRGYHTHTSTHLWSPQPVVSTTCLLTFPLMLQQEATRNKCHASSNRCHASSNRCLTLVPQVVECPS